MDPSLAVDLALLNNRHWYEALFRAHGVAWQADELAWYSTGEPPRFHSNLIVLSRAAGARELEPYFERIAAARPCATWSLKDSHACVDPSLRGFGVLFEARWIMRPAGAPEPRTSPSALTWSRVDTAGVLAAWERAWQGDAGNEQGRSPQFPSTLLAAPGFAFYAGQSHGQIVAGGVANASPGAVGISNVFSPPELEGQTWAGLVSCVGRDFAGVPMVGYERDSALEHAQRNGFQAVGPLRILIK